VERGGFVANAKWNCVEHKTKPTGLLHSSDWIPETLAMWILPHCVSVARAREGGVFWNDWYPKKGPRKKTKCRSYSRRGRVQTVSTYVPVEHLLYRTHIRLLLQSLFLLDDDKVARDNNTTRRGTVRVVPSSLETLSPSRRTQT
jgi:hypothetical protein